MSEIDHATLEARIARVSWARLHEVSLALDGCAGADEAVERVTARGLVPLDWFTSGSRQYGRAVKPRAVAWPERVAQIALVAASHATMLSCEALAREAYERSWGLPDDQAPFWYLVAGRYVDAGGTSCVRGELAWATYALDELSARNFDAEAFSYSPAHGGPDGEVRATPCTFAAASVLTTRTAWRALGRDGPSPAEPIIELYALGAAFCLDFGGLELFLPEPEYPLVACAKCKRVEPYEPASHRGEFRMRCPRCGLFCAQCFSPPIARECVSCGTHSSPQRAGPAG